jgi:hypothetical protein
VAQTPFERLIAAAILSTELETRLEAIFAALDPIRLLDQIGRLQEALWQHAVVRSSVLAAPQVDAPLRFTATVGGLTDQQPPTDTPPAPLVHQKRAYHRKHPQLPRWWRSRVDPFAEVWTDIEQWREANPSRTAKSLFVELQQRYPDRYPDVQLRTLQRRIARWRASVITTFDDQWLQEELLADAMLPRPLRASTAPDGRADPSTS